jgi:hypothetical protein
MASTERLAQRIQAAVAVAAATLGNPQRQVMAVPAL